MDAPLNAPHSPLNSNEENFDSKIILYLIQDDLTQLTCFLQLCSLWKHIPPIFIFPWRVHHLQHWDVQSPRHHTRCGACALNISLPQLSRLDQGTRLRTRLHAASNHSQTVAEVSSPLTTPPGKRIHYLPNKVWDSEGQGANLPWRIRRNWWLLWENLRGKKCFWGFCKGTAPAFVIKNHSDFCSVHMLRISQTHWVRTASKIKLRLVTRIRFPF